MVTILPVSSKVMVSPGLPTDRLQIMSGILNSTGGLQASDAKTYIITLVEDYFGTAELRFRISGKFDHCTSCVHVLDISWNYNP